MPCYHPIAARKRSDGSVELLSHDYGDHQFKLPCGQCIGCRLERARQWALRCMHEASQHDQNCFLTLTYDDEHLPPYGSLRHRDFQLFMKRLRKRVRRRISYYMCGEYGDDYTKRPHYHAAIFNYSPEDRLYHSRGSTGEKCYISPLISDLWPFGHHLIGNLSYESAGYVARYCLKKVTGDQAKEHYSVVDLHTGEIVQRQPEYARMSLRPAIAKNWIRCYLSDVYPRNYCVVNNHKCSPPKYYGRQFVLCKLEQGVSRLDAEAELEAIKSAGILAAESHWSDNTDRRLAEREEVKLAQLKFLKRHGGSHE